MTGDGPPAKSRPARLAARQELRLAAALWNADRPLAIGWWTALRLRGVLPAVFAIAMGALVGAVPARRRPGAPLALAGATFVLLQVLAPIHQAVSANLGDRTAAWLYDRLTDACVAPPGMGHLEDPSLTADLTVARDFDLGMTGPPPVDLDGLHRPGAWWRCSGLVSARRAVRLHLVGAAVAGRRLAGDALAAARERASGTTATPTKCAAAQRDADYAYRLAVDPPAGQGAAAVRAGRLDARPVRRDRRTTLHALQYEATRLRERPVLWSLLVVLGGERRWCSGRSARRRRRDAWPRTRRSIYAQAAVGHVADRVRRAELGARRRRGARWRRSLRLEPAMGPAGALPVGRPAGDGPARPRDPLP